MLQDTVVAQCAASIFQIYVQQGFLVPRVPLVKEIVVYNSFDWPEQRNAISRCRLDAVAQNLRMRKQYWKKLFALTV